MVEQVANDNNISSTDVVVRSRSMSKSEMEGLNWTLQRIPRSSFTQGLGVGEASDGGIRTLKLLENPQDPLHLDRPLRLRWIWNGSALNQRLKWSHAEIRKAPTTFFHDEEAWDLSIPVLNSSRDPLLARVHAFFWRFIGQPDIDMVENEIKGVIKRSADGNSARETFDELRKDLMNMTTGRPDDVRITIRDALNEEVTIGLKESGGLDVRAD
jgi:hypothetical protein